MNNTWIHANMWIIYWVFHPLLAIILFFISNWLGKHSYSFGYHKIDFIVDREDSAAFNFSLKVLTPTIFIILISAVLFHFKLDCLVKDIYLVALYSILLRIVINLFMSRFHILDWKLQIFYSITIYVVAYGAYINLILPKKPLIPDFNTISNELWILIGLFIYSLVNKIELSSDKKEYRIKKYTINQYEKFFKLYDSIISDEVRTKLSSSQNELTKQYPNKCKDSTFLQLNIDFIEMVVYSIMIFENFNRPSNIRRIENLLAKISPKERSLGIMQYKSFQLISDKESITLAINKIISEYESYIKDTKSGDFYSYNDCLEKICLNYNPSISYSNSIERIFEMLLEKLNKEHIVDDWKITMNDKN